MKKNLFTLFQRVYLFINIMYFQYIKFQAHLLFIELYHVIMGSLYSTILISGLYATYCFFHVIESPKFKQITGGPPQYPMHVEQNHNIDLYYVLFSNPNPNLINLIRLTLRCKLNCMLTALLDFH